MWPGCKNVLYLIKLCQALEGLGKHQGRAQVGQPKAMPPDEHLGCRVGRLVCNKADRQLLHSTLGALRPDRPRLV